MLVTSTQVSWAVSAGIITFFTLALFLSGYVLQRQTVSSLREAIPDIPNKQILAQAARARDAIPVPTIENPRFRGSSASRKEQQQPQQQRVLGGGAQVATDEEEGLNVDVQVLEVEDTDVIPQHGETRGGGSSSGSDKAAAEQREATGGNLESSRRAGNGGSVGTAAMKARGPVRRPVGWPGGANGAQYVQAHHEGDTAEAARKRHEREQTRQMAAAVDPNDALVRAGLDEFSVGRGSRPQSGAKKKEEMGTGKQHDNYKAQKANHYEDHGPFDAGGTLISIREDGVHAVDMRQQQREQQRGL